MILYGDLSCLILQILRNILIRICERQPLVFKTAVAFPMESAAAHSHTHDGLAPHTHDAFDATGHGHSHEILDGPGSYLGREMPLSEGRDWSDRAYTIGIGGYASLASRSLLFADICAHNILEW